MDFKAYLKEIETFIDSEKFGDYPTELYEPLRYIMSLGGKRLRPILTLIGFNLYDSDWQKIVKPAVAVEVFHNFTLLHDDLMDNAPTRRGKDTVHEKWNANIAILSGDVMLVKAYEMMMQVPDSQLRSVLDLFNQTAAEVCEGQQIDMNFEKMAAVTEAEYLNMIRLKTSVLLGFALQLGGILANQSLKEQELLYQIGLKAGMGFQLMDDILDVYGDPLTFGKQVGGDILSNKKTLLLIEATNLATGSQKEALSHWVNATDFDPKEKVKAVTEIYNQLNIKEKSMAIAQNYFEECAHDIQLLHTDKKEILTAFFEQLRVRIN